MGMSLMRVIFWASDKVHEEILAASCARGSDDFEIRDLSEWQGRAEGDAGAFVGLKGGNILDTYKAAGKPCLVFDKGYSRMSDDSDIPKTNYWRVAINHTQPTSYIFNTPLPSDRWDVLNRKYKHKLKSRIEDGDRVLYFASSNRYHTWHNLPTMQDYARSVIGSIRKHWDGKIIYCPKPQSFTRDKIEPIPGAFLRNRRDRVKMLLAKAHCAVVHGSGAAVECILNGCPVIVLGDAITKPVSGTKIETIKNPWWPTNEEREQWAWNFAYAQWTPKEMASGAMWDFQKWCISKYDL